MDPQNKRLKLDVMIPFFTHTFTERFDHDQECLVMEKLVEYRDWLDQVAGEKLCQDYHLVLVDTRLSREDIQQMEKDRFWMSAHDTWGQLRKVRINPSAYDLVWCMWAWQNVADAKQMYGGGALLGPETTPFMSFSVSQFAKTDPGITMVLEHEAQHTYEMLFYHTGQVVDTTLPLQGFPHADYLDTFLEEMLKEEPGLFEPFMSDAEALEHRRDGSRPWPGFTMQRTVNAWTHSRLPQECYLKIAERFGQIVPGPAPVQVEPLLASITVISDQPERQVYLPVRVRAGGRHVAEVAVTAEVEHQVVVFKEDTYYRHEKIRMPKQERWSVGWAENSYYVGELILSRETETIKLKVQGADFTQTFTIPVKYIVASTEENTAWELMSTNGEPTGNGQKTIIPGERVVYRMPVEDYADAVIHMAGAGEVEMRLSMTGRYYVPLWAGTVRQEPTQVAVPEGLIRSAKQLYLQLQAPREQKESFILHSLSLIGTRYL